MTDETNESSLSHEGDKDTRSTRVPIWHSPAWITAMVGLVSAFLTVPDQFGAYLSKRQDIELARQQTEAARLTNIDSKQAQEYEIVHNTLAQQGTERIFVLRYLAATLDDEDAKRWASEEVARLDELATSQEKLEKTRRDFQNMEQELTGKIDRGENELSKLTEEVENLRTNLNSETTKVTELRQKAGFASNQAMKPFLHIRVERDPDSVTEDLYAHVDFGAVGYTCHFDTLRYCDMVVVVNRPNALKTNPPKALQIILKGGPDLTNYTPRNDEFHSISVALYDTSESITPSLFWSFMPRFVDPVYIPYSCSLEREQHKCIRI